MGEEFVVLYPRAEERAAERGATANEVISTITQGERFPERISRQHEAGPGMPQRRGRRGGLGTDIAALFKGIRLLQGEEIPELHGHSLRMYLSNDYPRYEFDASCKDVPLAEPEDR